MGNVTIIPTRATGDERWLDAEGREIQAGDVVESPPHASDPLVARVVKRFVEWGTGVPRLFVETLNGGMATVFNARESLVCPNELGLLFAAGWQILPTSCTCGGSQAWFFPRYVPSGPDGALEKGGMESAGCVCHSSVVDLWAWECKRPHP